MRTIILFTIFLLCLIATVLIILKREYEYEDLVGMMMILTVVAFISTIISLFI